MERVPSKRRTRRSKTQEIDDSIAEHWRVIEQLFIEAAQKQWNIERAIKGRHLPLLADDCPSEPWILIREMFRAIRTLEDQRRLLRGSKAASSSKARSRTKRSSKSSEPKQDPFH